MIHTNFFEYVNQSQCCCINTYCFIIQNLFSTASVSVDRNIFLAAVSPRKPRHLLWTKTIFHLFSSSTSAPHKHFIQNQMHAAIRKLTYMCLSADATKVPTQLYLILSACWLPSEKQLHSLSSSISTTMQCLVAFSKEGALFLCIKVILQKHVPKYDEV